MSQIVQFIKSSLLEINPAQNIKILHTNIKNDIVAGIMVAIIALPLGLTLYPLELFRLKDYQFY